MSIDWQRLAEVREHQKTLALGAVARDRAAAERSGALLQQAEDRRAQQQQDKLRHWEATRGALAGGGCSMAELRQAGAWSGALDARIAEAERAAAQALEAHAEREQLLERSRRALRATQGELEKARRMHERERGERLRLEERRREDANDEAGTQAWALRRSA